jgi:ABC-type sugar transport system ATPase subunit
MHALELDHLSKSFGAGWAVDGVNLRVPVGQRLVILGPSGCGKTTILRLIAGLEQPSAGSIRYGGVDWADRPPARRQVAMAFQDATLYPHLSVRENLAFALRELRLSASELRIRIGEVVDAFGLGAWLDRAPQTLSGGERGRVAFARGVLRRPEVLLLDEPLSGLDSPSRWQLQSVWLEWHRRYPTTTVHVTHDQQEALTLGDQVAIMRAGRIEQVGSPAALYQQPANGFVAGFLGSPGMNLVAAHIADAVVVIGADGVTVSRDRFLPGELPAAGRAISVGVRPESIRVESGTEATAAEAGDRELLVIPGQVSELRMAGRSWLVAFSWGGGRWWAWRTDPGSLATGQPARMILSLRSLRWFVDTEGEVVTS